MLDMIVTDERGNRISFERATGRFLAGYVSALIVMLGYIAAAFDEKTQTLHDRWAKTVVIHKSSHRQMDADVFA